MMISGVLFFTAAVFFLSFQIGRSKDMDRGRIAVYMTLVAWGSLIYGLSMAKIAP